jgi:hypothetical protein
MMQRTGGATAMSKFFEVWSAICWLALAVNRFLSLGIDETWVIVSAVLFALWALLHEMRERKP